MYGLTATRIDPVNVCVNMIAVNTGVQLNFSYVAYVYEFVLVPHVQIMQNSSFMQVTQLDLDKTTVSIRHGQASNTMSSTLSSLVMCIGVILREFC